MAGNVLTILTSLECSTAGVFRISVGCFVTQYAASSRVNDCQVMVSMMMCGISDAQLKLLCMASVMTGGCFPVTSCVSAMVS